MAKTKKTTKKRSTKKKQTAMAPSTKGQCMSLATAGKIVQDAVPGGPHPIDNTLKDCGLISSDQRKVFRAQIYDRVHRIGCSIKRGEIPSGSASTLRQVRWKVRDNAE